MLTKEEFLENLKKSPKQREYEAKAERLENAISRCKVTIKTLQKDSTCEDYYNRYVGEGEMEDAFEDFCDVTNNSNVYENADAFNASGFLHYVEASYARIK